MLSSKPSRIKTPDRAATSGSPVRATAASSQADTERESTVRKAVLTFENNGDMWHLLTTYPDDFKERCFNLGRLLQKHRDEIIKKLEHPQQYDSLQDDIFEAILGVLYYTYIRRDPTKLEVPARHTGHTVIYEVAKNKYVKGVNHGKKALESNLPMLEGILDRLEAIANLQCSRQAAPLLREVDRFIDYIELHLQCLQQILAYNPITAVPRTVVFNPLSVTMQRWHPCAMKLTTPIEATPSCAKNRQDYQEYVQTRKASRVGWTKEDTQAVAQEWQTAMYSNHAASAASAAASTTNDEDLGFDFNGWANSPARPKPAVLPSDEDLGFDFAGWGNSPVPVATTATTTTSAAISPADAISALSINQTPSSTATSLARRLFQT